MHGGGRAEGDEEAETLNDCVVEADLEIAVEGLGSEVGAEPRQDEEARQPEASGGLAGPPSSALLRWTPLVHGAAYRIHASPGSRCSATQIILGRRIAFSIAQFFRRGQVELVDSRPRLSEPLALRVKTQ